MRTPRCHHAAHDPETDAYVVLLEDVAPARQGDQMAGCPVDDIAAAIDELVLLQGPRWGDETLTDIAWLHRASPEAGRRHRSASSRYAVGPFEEHYTERLDADTVALVDRLVPRLDGYLRPPAPAVDDRPRRLPGRQPAVRRRPGGRRRLADRRARAGAVRPQLPARRQPDARGPPPPRGDARRPLRRRAWSRQGVDVDRDDVWEQYRRYAFGGLIMAIVASALVRRTDRGDDMFVTMAERHARQALDLDAESL